MEKLLIEMAAYLVKSYIHNWLPLSLAIVTAAVLIVYVKPEKIKQALLHRSNVSIPVSVAAGAFTPLCACGTMAVIIGMLTTALPWGPVMAFLTSSPLMSPDGFILIAGIISTKFAIALAVSSVIIGIGSGYMSHWIEKKSDYLNDQVRFVRQNKTLAGSSDKQACDCSASAYILPEIQTCGCSEKIINLPDTANKKNVKINSSKLNFCCDSQSSTGSYNREFYYNFMQLESLENIAKKISGFIANIKWKEISKEILNTGLKQILLYYTVFAAIGFLINHFVPASFITGLFSSKNVFAVPLAALIGLPLYVNGESAVPLIQTLLNGGAGEGAMLAFLITGPGTSAGVIAGISAILKKRAVILYIFFLLSGGIFLGYLYDLYLFFS